MMRNRFDFFILLFVLIIPVSSQAQTPLSEINGRPELIELQKTLEQPDFIGQFGTCYEPPSLTQFKKNWDNYSEKAKKKIKINAENIANMSMPISLAEHITHITRLKSLIEEVNQLDDIKWVTEFLKNPVVLAGFQTQSYFDFVKSDEGMKALAQVNKMTPEQMDNFSEHLQIIQAMMNGKTYIRSIDYAILHGLSIFDEDERRAILEMNKFFMVTLKKANEKEVFYPLRDYLNKKIVIKLSAWPLIPSTIKGEWAKLVRDLTEDGIKSYLFNNPVGDLALDNLIPPVAAKNPFEEWFENAEWGKAGGQEFLYKNETISQTELAAIDHVTRTLWGEARGCTPNYPQLEAIGRILADRAEAIKMRVQEDIDVREHNLETIESVSEKFAKRDSLGKLLRAKLSGLSDFGRPERADLPLVAQATSKPGQFSVWNSFTVEKILLSKLRANPKLPPNIPNISIPIRKGRSLQDQKALINVLCPEISKNADLIEKKVTSDGTWNYLVELSTLLVLDPELYQKLFLWDGKKERKIYFYTHGNVNLPFAVEKKVSTLKFLADPQNIHSKTLSNKNPAGICYMRTFINAPTVLYHPAK
ncbi:MAG: hypothetical protein A2504_06020 [Bdellovibrionales bacterium RIFOXYD12_FULL_39_22]|nr:MAG: hypothetical protein A2385_08340 [Bdellovibrionales bacterium RIFOXYB1_FULL_39_21]OFZ45287.1 MAG: hypothetical protein A2485_06195 [Bdellovibrionales bacterium RIFOXYC12_FULL_39_17]OFZ45523.1 MAG: hypothetical protein A2404_02920 [Bdellovibrionales bacterium RIFOXYC1_FULL_39_130]OFZ77384.1 MAG: hypothetical protein A2560_08510 [Bdellovibrionales bacterium RIFOXYD1_FULL_39_84]OFZ91513.1 MAG: hypothetical protein A2504_06020 [Bdellovibrionales bacterium RIFOXYD12_FULL_39_22]HLE12031.1 hy